jgi:selenocysteine-specific elongation factor
MTLAVPHAFHSTSQLDISLSLLRSAKPLKDRTRVHFHAFTMETIAEVRLHEAKQIAPGSQGYAQLRLAEPTLLLPGDRFILRQFSPVLTIGGGVVLDAAPLPKTKKENARDFLELLQSGPEETMLEARIARRDHHGVSLSQLVVETGLRTESVLTKLARALEKGTVRRIADTLVSASSFAHLLSSLTNQVAEFHKENPLVAGISKEELRDKLQVTAEI